MPDINQSDPKNWLFSVTLPNWELLKRDNVWAVRSEAVKSKINMGDRLIFFVKGSQPPSIMGVYEVVGEWRLSSKLRWTEEKPEQRIIYPWEVDMKPILLGTLNMRENIGSLAFIENKNKWAVYLIGSPANLHRPIGDADYEFILAKMKMPPYIVEFKPKPAVVPTGEPKLPTIMVKPQPPPSAIKELTHPKICNMIIRLGELEDYIVEGEVPVNGERLDVTWRRKLRKFPDIAFEVQLKGNLFQALTKLKEAWDLWRCISILVTTGEYEEDAKRWLPKAFHEMDEDARIVRWETISQWLEAAEKRKRIKDELKI